MDEYIQRILQVLVEVDEAPAYQIGKKTGMPHATVHKKLQQALKAELIQVKNEKRFRTGLLTKTYTITPKGLVAFLSSYNFERLHQDQVILKAVSEKISQLLFKQWQKFLEYVPEGYALFILREVVVGFLDWLERTHKKPEDLFLERFAERLGVSAFLWNLWKAKAPPVDEIAAFLNSEPELKEIVNKELSKKIESLRRALAHWQNIQERIQGKA